MLCEASKLMGIIRQVDQCCCCCGCTLQTGTKIIGWIHLIGGLIFIGLCATMMTVKLTTPVAALGAIYVSIPVIIISVISIAVSIPVLIASSKNKKPELLLPWLIFNVTTLIFGIGYAIYVTVAVILPEEVTTGLVYFFIILIAFAFGVYFWLVIFNYYRHLKEQISILHSKMNLNKNYY